MKQNRNVVRLNESQLKAMIAESVKMVLKEDFRKEIDAEYNDGYENLPAKNPRDLKINKYKRVTVSPDEESEFEQYMNMRASSKNVMTKIGEKYSRMYGYKYRDFTDMYNQLYNSEEGVSATDWDRFENAYNDYMSATGKIGHSSGRIDDLYSLDTESEKWRLKNESKLRKIVSEAIDRILKNK